MVSFAFVNLTQQISTTCVGAVGHEIGIYVTPDNTKLYHVAGKSRLRQLKYGHYLAAIDPARKRFAPYWIYDVGTVGFLISATNAPANTALLIASEHQIVVAVRHWLTFFLLLTFILVRLRRRRNSQRLAEQHGRTLNAHR